MFSLARVWSKRDTRMNIAQLKLGNIAVFLVSQYSKLFVFRKTYLKLVNNS